MRYKLITVFFVTLSFFSNAQESPFSKGKAKIITEIINETTKSQSNAKFLVIANMEYKNIEATYGIAAGMKISNEAREDSSAVRYINEILRSNQNKHRDLIFKSFKEINFNNRYELINSRNFLLDKDKRTKIYIEINEPIDGWEICKLYVEDSLWSGVKYMSYQAPRLCIPVFVYTSESGTESLVLYLFRFELLFANSSFTAKLIDYKPI